jgi:putative proteasome-type protease
LFQIYAGGNFIEATTDTPFFQIGEHKYGKPILDRVAQTTMKLGDAAKLVLLSFDSTVRSNLSVGLPIDMLTYETGTLKLEHTKRIGLDDPYFKMLSSEWSKALRGAFANIEAFDI